MVKRTGIAATSASAVVFTIVLISNFAIYAASQSRASLYSQSDFEDYLGVNAAAFAGASGANILLELQYFLSGRTFVCSSAFSVVSAEIAGLTDAQSANYVNESASAQAAPEAAVADNLSSLAPFNGSLSGDLDLYLRVVYSGGSAAGGVWLVKSEVHLLHLPLHLDEAVAECLGDVQSIIDAVSGSTLTNCTASEVSSFMSSLGSQLASNASADGFSFALQYKVTSLASCSVRFQVSIVQEEIPGIGGPFDVLLEENGSASFAEPE